MRERLDDWQQREASVCPEDFGFEEVIKSLRAEVARLRPYEAFVQAIDRGEIRHVGRTPVDFPGGKEIQVFAQDRQTTFFAPDALSAWLRHGKRMRDFLKLFALIVALDVWHEGRHAEGFWVRVLASALGLFVVTQIADSYYRPTPPTETRDDD